MVELPADQAQQEPDASCVPGSCPCSCLRSMVRVVDAVSTEQAALTWEDAEQDVTHFAPRVVLAVIGDSSDLDAAVEGRGRLGLPVIAICQHGVGCPADKASSVDGVLGLPLDLDDLRRMLTRVLH